MGAAGTNLDFLAGSLARSFDTVDAFRIWLDAGVRTIVMDGQPEVSAFDPGRYIIGCQGPDWRHDLGVLLAKLDQRHRLMLREGLRRCIDFLKPEPAANDPSRGHGHNSERLALVYLSFARDWKTAEVLPALDALIHTKFPASNAVYASSLLTWRVLADQDSTTDWREVFLPFGDAGREPRFQPPYSAAIVAGMCLAQPRNAADYLDWPPLAHYRQHLVQNLSGAKIEEFLRVTQLRPRFGPRPAALTPVDVAADLVNGQPSGLRRAWANARDAAPAARMPLPPGSLPVDRHGPGEPGAGDPDGT